MKTVFHSASERGHADHGWLEARHSFSFAGFYDAEKVHFGALRVLNDDRVAPARGFGMHPHRDMEIVTIPLEGALAHRDSMGNAATIQNGEVQIMSAGTGIQHSEFNASQTDPVRLLQIWVFPRSKNLPPRYDQKKLEIEGKNGLSVIVSPENDGSVDIIQDAWFSLGRLENGFSGDYSIKKSGNGAYCFLIEGEAEIAGQKLERRDAIGIWDAEKFEIKTTDAAVLLVIDVPMDF